MSKEFHFWFDDSGDPGLRRGSKYHMVSTIFSENPKIVKTIHSCAISALCELDSSWSNREIHGKEMSEDELRIVLKQVRS
ncbi:MAG TPA: hypothetical protein VFF13_00400, partial [archaeon]|nr:hypothetical protein [archaeon]